MSLVNPFTSRRRGHNLASKDLQNTSNFSLELLAERDVDLMITTGDFQERCHSFAAVQAACINGTRPGSLSSSGGWLIQTTSG